MRNFLNKYAINQVTFDSGALNQNSSIVHTIREEGIYEGYILCNGVTIRNFDLSVTRNSSEKQVIIDCYTYEGDVSKNKFTLSPNGTCIFYVSSGTGGYAVTMQRRQEFGAEQIFDSRELIDGDYFTATISHPGLYMVTNHTNSKKLRFVVPYPNDLYGKSVKKPISIECYAGGFFPRTIIVQAGSGIVFYLKTSSRLSLELLKSIEKRAPNKTEEMSLSV